MILLREFVGDVLGFWHDGLTGRITLIWLVLWFVLMGLFLLWCIPADVSCHLGHTPWPLSSC